MKRKLILFIYFILLVFGAENCKREVAVKSNPNEIQLQVGAYLSTNYMKRIAESHSPKIAQNDSNPCSAYVKKGSDSSTYISIGNFHEGWAGLNLYKDGKITTSIDWPESKKYSIKVINADELLITNTAGIKAVFKYVGNESRWVSIAVFRGEYHNSNNQLFTFSDSNFSTPNGEKYLYKAQIDCYGGPPLCDYLELNNVPFHFTFSADTLKISEFYGVDNMQIRKQPKWWFVKRNTP